MQLFKTRATVAEARVLELTTQLEAANTARQTAETKLSAYEAEGVTLLDLQGKLDTAASDLQAANGRTDAYRGALGTEGFFTFGEDETKPVVALTSAGEAHFINAKAGRVVAGAGHQPLPLAVDSPTPGNKATAKTGAGRTRETWNK